MPPNHCMQPRRSQASNLHTRIFPVSAVRLMLAVLGVMIFSISSPITAAPPSVIEQVFAVERAFAKSMAERNFDDFTRFISEEAVFFAGTRPLRGKAQITDEWSEYFKEATAPFSWEPDQVEVLESGSLALSTGPVRDSAGTIVARFNSIWRLEAPGVWRIVFDKGSPASPGPK